MRRSRILAGAALTVALVALPALVLAQSPNLSGTWKMNSEKSVLPQMPSGGGGRAPRGGGAPGGGMFPQEITIKHEGNRVEMTWTQQGMGRQASSQTITRVFTTDGKPTDNEQGGRGGKVAVKAEWKNNMLMVDENSEFSTPDGQTRSMTTSYSLTLSPDGQSLLRYQEMSRGETIMSANIVYDKIK